MLTKLRQIGNRSIKSSTAPFLQGWRSGRRWLDGEKHQANQVMILGYHQVVDDIIRAEDEAIFGMVISTATFRRQMKLLRERYEVLSLAQAAAVLNGEAATKGPAVVITFDDGYRDVYENAWPILRELGLPATVFASTAYVNTKQWLDHDLLYWFVCRAKARGLSLRVPLIKAGLNLQEAVQLTAEVDSLRLCDRLIYQPLARRQAIIQQLSDFLGEPSTAQSGRFALLTWAMIREMAEGGISFGAHTERHPILTLEDAPTIESEIARNQQALEEVLGQPVKHFAYPNGQYNQTVKEAVQRRGFELAVTTERRVNRVGDDLLTLGRLCLCEESTRGLTGHYSETVARLRLAV